MFANPTFLESFYLKLYELLLIISQGVLFGREGYVNFESSLGIKSTFRAVSSVFLHNSNGSTVCPTLHSTVFSSRLFSTCMKVFLICVRAILIWGKIAKMDSIYMRIMIMKNKEFRDKERSIIDIRKLTKSIPTKCSYNKNAIELH